MYMVQRPYRISLKVGIDRKRSDQLLLFSRSLFHSLVLSAITHREVVFFFPSVSLALSNCSFNQRIGPKSGSNIMSAPIAMEIMSACRSHGLFRRTPRTQQSQYSLACQSRRSLPCVISQNSSIYLNTEVVCKHMR